MNKIVSLIFVPALALLSSCGQNNEEKANKLFVEGAIKASAAIKESNNYNAKEAVVLMQEAIANCDKILREFPETNIAVSLVSGKDLNLGSLKYADLPEKLESMKRLSNYSQKFGAVGELLYGSSMDSVSEAFETLYNWREPTYKTAPNKQVENFFPKKFEQEPILNPARAPQAKAETKSAVVDIAMEDVMPLSKQIKLDVALISYEKSALENLLKMSEDIISKPNLLELYTPYISKMKENIAKITMADQREGAYLALSKILANMDKSEAASIAFFNIKNEDLQTQALVYYVNCLVERRNYKNAIDLLANIKSQAIKDEMALDMSKLLRQNLQIDLALKVLDYCADKERRNDALVEIVAQVILDSNLAEVSKFLESNVGILTENQLEILSKSLTLMDTEDFSERSLEYKNAAILNEIIALFAPNNSDYATKLSQSMMDMESAINDRNERALLLKKHLDTATLFESMDASKLIESKHTKSLLGAEQMQDVYLKYFVYHSLNGEELKAKFYLDLIDPKIASREKVVVALLKANKSKEEILKVIEN